MAKGQRREKQKVHHELEPGMKSTVGTGLLPGEPNAGGRAGEMHLLFIGAQEPPRLAHGLAGGAASPQPQKCRLPGHCLDLP